MEALVRLLMNKDNATALEELSNSETDDSSEVVDAQSDIQDEVSDHEDSSSLALQYNLPESQTPPIPPKESSLVIQVYWPFAKTVFEVGRVMFERRAKGVLQIEQLQ